MMRGRIFKRGDFVSYERQSGMPPVVSKFARYKDGMAFVIPLYLLDEDGSLAWDFTWSSSRSSIAIAPEALSPAVSYPEHLQRRGKEPSHSERGSMSTQSKEIPAGGYPALEGESVRTEAQHFDAAGLLTISLAEAMAIKHVVGGYAYPIAHQRRVLTICEAVILRCVNEKMREFVVALAKPQPGEDVSADGASSLYDPCLNPLPLTKPFIRGSLEHGDRLAVLF